MKEIRSKRFYVPELDLVMIDENNCVIGLAIFSKFHLGGKYENQLLLLSPVAVKTELQRQHISKDLIEVGFEKAKFKKANDTLTNIFNTAIAVRATKDLKEKIQIWSHCTILLCWRTDYVLDVRHPIWNTHLHGRLWNG